MGEKECHDPAAFKVFKVSTQCPNNKIPFVVNPTIVGDLHYLTIGLLHLARFQGFQTFISSDSIPEHKKHLIKVMLAIYYLNS